MVIMGWFKMKSCDFTVVRSLMFGLLKYLYSLFFSLLCFITGLISVFELFF